MQTRKATLLQKAQARARAMPSLPPGRRLAFSYNYSFGRLTRSGSGAVFYADLPNLNTSGVAVTSWVCAPAHVGTDSHWNRNPGGTSTVTPAPASHGSTNAAEYRFIVTATFADNLIETFELIISTVADAFNVSQRDGFGNGGQYTTSHLPNASIASKTVLISTGAKYATTIQLLGLAPATPATVRHANLERPCSLPSLECRGSSNLVIDDIRLSGAGAVNGRMVFYNNSGTPNSNITINRLKIAGDPFLIDDDSGVAKPNYNAFVFQGASNIVINDAECDWVYNGISAGGNFTFTGVVFNNLRIRGIFDNFAILGSAAGFGPSDITLNDTVAAGYFRARKNGTHLDGFQISDGSQNTTININRMLNIHADGDAYEQNLHYGGNVLGVDACTLNINGYIYVGRSYYAMNIGHAKNWTVRNCTFWRSDSGGISTVGVENGSPVDDSPAHLGPYINIGSAADNYAGTNLIDKVIVYQDIRGASEGLFTVTNTFEHNGTEASTPTGTGFAENNPRAVLEAIDYENMTLSQIVTAVKSALRPAAGGAYHLGGGVYAGALNPDGSWNTAI